jgi:hypothetical protein
MAEQSYDERDAAVTDDERATVVGTFDKRTEATRPRRSRRPASRRTPSASWQAREATGTADEAVVSAVDRSTELVTPDAEPEGPAEPPPGARRGTLVVVTADSRYREVEQILRRCGASEIKVSFRSSGC